MIKVNANRLALCFLLCSSIACTTSSPAARSEGFDARLSTYSYPFAVENFDLTSQGQALQMSYMDLKPVEGLGKKEPIVLLHGKNFSGFYFDRLAKDLAAKGHRVIIPDQIGFGKSSKPKGYQYSFAQLAHNTQALLKHLQIPSYSILGHSMGGMLATRMALSYPTEVKRLILINPIGLEDYRVLTSYKPIDEIYQNELKATAESIRNYQSEAYYDKQWKNEYDSLLVPAIGWTKGPDKELLAYTAALTSDMIFNQPVSYEFGQLKVPLIAVMGQRDRTAIGKAWASPANRARMGDYPKLGRELRRQAPEVKLIELPGLGHVPFVEDYALFAKSFYPALD